jgi:hypothetical protein
LRQIATRLAAAAGPISAAQDSRDKVGDGIGVDVDEAVTLVGAGDGAVRFTVAISGARSQNRGRRHNDKGQDRSVHAIIIASRPVPAMAVFAFRSRR